MSLSKSVIDQFYSEANASYQRLESEKSFNIISHYLGDLNSSISNDLSTKVEEQIESITDRKTIKKRFFIVFVEAIQNIRLHGECDAENQIHSMVTAFHNGDKICARFYNIIKGEAAEGLISRFDLLNKLNEVEIKEMYRDVMKNGSRSDKGGAGLGLITMVMRSKNPCLTELINLNQSFKLFGHSVCVDLK
jgi:hypothetical protein